jgi:hypothetical protein
MSFWELYHWWVSWCEYTLCFSPSTPFSHENSKPRPAADQTHFWGRALENSRLVSSVTFSPSQVDLWVLVSTQQLSRPHSPIIFFSSFFFLNKGIFYSRKNDLCASSMSEHCVCNGGSIITSLFSLWTVMWFHILLPRFLALAKHLYQ